MSVSKFHGWFELDETFGLYVVDAGSTNHTVVRSRQLIARAREPVSSGTGIRFGGIDTLVIDASSLWNAYHASSA
jgi:FHA domain-containing protein